MWSPRTATAVIVTFADTSWRRAAFLTFHVVRDLSNHKHPVNLSSHTTAVRDTMLRPR
jgi:hypothetical protein